MDKDSIQYLKTSLENENNIPIFDLTSAYIKKSKEAVIQELPITKNNFNELKKKLKDYRFVDEIQELHIGAHTRWINLKIINDALPNCKKLDNVYLNKGAVLVDINIDNNINLVFKNYINKFFSINMDENLIFQKLTNQEKIILFTIDNIDKIKV